MSTLTGGPIVERRSASEVGVSLRLLSLLLTFSMPALASASDPLNRVIGDAGWAGSGATSEVERIRAHLAFVEARLRANPPSIDRRRLDRRSDALAALARYREAGLFPRRTGDPYPGRRPRFIDDRGVHCAVGEMIRATGHAELARRINAHFEYAYVEQITDPELKRWARRHRFSVKELAMIQPGYAPPPDEAQIEAAVRDATERITLECARDHEPADGFRIRVLYRPHEDLRFRSIRWFDGFVQCFLLRARESIRVGDDAYDAEPRRVRTRMRVRIESPQAILERRLNAIDLGPDATPCYPRPGAVPTRVAVRVRVDDQGLHAQATTSPSNEAVDACLEAQLTEELGALFGAGRWRLEAQIERSLEPRVTSERMRRALESYLPGFATECWSEGGPSRLQVRVTAVRDADTLTLAITGAGEDFQTCLAPKLREQLRRSLGATIPQPDGARVLYFRADADADALLSIDVEPPAEREVRIQRQQEETGRRTLERAQDH